MSIVVQNADNAELRVLDISYKRTVVEEIKLPDYE